MSKSLLTLFILTASLNLTGQSNGELADALVSAGFENVEVLSENNGQVRIAYENRIYRYDLMGLAHVLSLVKSSGIPSYTITPKYLNIGLVDIYGDSSNQSLINHIKLARNFHREYNDRLYNPTFFKADFSVGPVISGSQLGNYGTPIRMVLDIGYQMNMQLPMGLRASAQLLVPLFNNLSEDRVRAGIITLASSFRLPWSIYGNWQAGWFTRRRFGILIDGTKYFWNGRIGIGAEWGQTTWSRISGPLVFDFIEKFNFWQYRGFLIGRIPRQDLTLKIMLGTFMLQDTGVKIDLSRQFGQSVIGVFALKTAQIENAGFNIRVPLPTKSYPRFDRLVRFRTSSHFRYEYNFKGQTLFRGATFYTGERLQDKLWEYHPDFIENNLSEAVDLLKMN